MLVDSSFMSSQKKNETKTKTKTKKNKKTKKRKRILLRVVNYLYLQNIKKHRYATNNPTNNNNNTLDNHHNLASCGDETSGRPTFQARYRGWKSLVTAAAHEPRVKFQSHSQTTTNRKILLKASWDKKLTLAGE